MSHSFLASTHWKMKTWTTIKETGWTHTWGWNRSLLTSLHDKRKLVCDSWKRLDKSAISTYCSPDESCVGKFWNTPTSQNSGKTVPYICCPKYVSKMADHELDCWNSFHSSAWIFLMPPCPEYLWNPPNLLFSEYKVFTCWEISCCCLHLRL